METKTYTTIDRAALGWPSGEWDSEPDKMQWPDETTGLPCLAVRHPRSGHWCGYVGVAEGHPMFQKGYDDCEPEAYWGLTFADMCRPGETETTGICHVPAAGEPEHVWWLGFDCAHCDDFSPRDAARFNDGYPFGQIEGTSYKTLGFVRNQCARLAAQLADMPRSGPLSGSGVIEASTE